ncbi:MAG: class I SAM-dependent methyltransferase [Candidatus Pacebacteria bacterium]|nr:class I SAM-dependent methyltransferase [Candidatus Paceibacterota bacterium]
MWKTLTKTVLKLHNFAYKLSSVLAIKQEGKHPKHRLTSYHRFFLDNIQKGNKVLDIGCGWGELAFDLAKKAKKVVAIDLNEAYLKKAKQKNSLPNIEYVLGDATTYSFKEHFDVVVLSNVLEHIEKRVEFLRKIKPLANKFLIRVPMLNRDWIVLYKKEMGVEYFLDKGHFTEYTLEELQAELSQAGYTVENYSIQFGEFYFQAKRE